MRGCDAEGAAACFRAVVDNEPDNARAHDHLGVALELKGDFNDAIASFGRAIALDPTDERMRQHLKEMTSRGGVLYPVLTRGVTW